MANMPPRPAGATDPAIKVYEHANLGGWQLAFIGEQVNNIGSDANDKISSVQVLSGKWELFADAEFKGTKLTLGKGTVPDLAPLGLNDKVSSLRPVAW
ncbi:beta/gamma crystallin-related protein [Prosthecobacter sp.]|uniref:beta/gamma crystallin-related protein n=1 Tax=Prosthecobacter sp. TaxID=1965333 RepID=UPI001E16D7E8|nr:beta/gamma crystallin-related protein [Prosthecobacter sp.]MCB1278904.1 beta/gamma crystallin family protein [Prosthecobacter sp.]